MTKLTEFAFKVARRIHQVPDEVSNEDALAKGFITPEMIEAIVMIITQIISGCLANNRAQAWRRINIFKDAKKPVDRIADNTRLAGIVHTWIMNLAMPREPGDVKAIRNALAMETSELKQEEFDAIHTEAMFLTI